MKKTHSCDSVHMQIHRGLVNTTSQAALSDVVQCAYRSLQQHDMWQALRLTEAGKYPATSSLPSRTASLAPETDTATTTENDASKREESAISLRMMDLIGIPLNPVLRTVSQSMKRTSRYSLHTITSVTKLAHSSSEQKDCKKKKKILPG